MVIEEKKKVHAWKEKSKKGEDPWFQTVINDWKDNTLYVTEN